MWRRASAPLAARSIAVVLSWGASRLRRNGFVQSGYRTAGLVRLLTSQSRRVERAHPPLAHHDSVFALPDRGIRVRKHHLSQAVPVGGRQVGDIGDRERGEDFLSIGQ